MTEVSSAPRKTGVRSTIQKRDEKGVIRHGAEWLALWSDPESMKTTDEKRSEAAVSKARAEFEHSIAATARSISADPEFRIALDSTIDASSASSLRGRADSIALQRRFHNGALHAQLAPSDPPIRRLFDVCERVRCEALGAHLYPGVKANLAAQQFHRLDISDLLNAHLALLIPVSEGLEMVLRDVLLGETEPSISSPGMRMWDRWIRDRYSPHIAGLGESLVDQSEFAHRAISFVKALVAELGSDESRMPKLQPSQSGDEGEVGPDPRLRESTEGSLLHPGSEVHGLAAPPVHIDASAVKPQPYKVFTFSYDRIVLASDLFDGRHLRGLRESLEIRRADIRRDLARLTAKFQRRLLARQTRDWTFDLDEGLLDAARLDRVIVNPGFASAYKQERESNFPDTVVTVLIDNSGSMRGKPIEIACLAADLISAALDRCGISSEILGFTTAGWKGGQSAKEWVRNGRPAEPGRLNDLLHIVYKSAGEPARRSRTSLAAMLDPGLLKENVDGEALVWASRRLLARPEKRKVLIVISDGAPVDQATLENNSDKQILDRHLRQVIEQTEESGLIEIAAIGVKHEVARYYSRGVQVDKPEKLGASLIEMVDQLVVQKT